MYDADLIFDRMRERRYEAVEAVRKGFTDGRRKSYTLTTEELETMLHEAYIRGQRDGRSEWKV